MNKDIKRDIKTILLDTENRVAETLVRRKYKKDGRQEPGRSSLRAESEAVVARANHILAHRGKKVWAELKKACICSQRGEDGND